nr:CMRF35-like molecule 9 [Misgurnus anguillicaudatus]
MTAPDLSVMSSSVIVDEGGNISVQCLYSTEYRNKHKQWCRYKDKRCYTVGRSETSQNASVEISDDGRGCLTVVMSGLMKSVSGWYYCFVGDLQAPVKLTVTVAVTDLQTSVEFTVTEAISAVTSDSSSTRDMRDIQYDDLKMWLLPIVLLLLLVTVTSVILRNKHNRKNNHITNEKKVSDEDDSVNLPSVNPECDVTYSSGNQLPKTECEPADIEENDPQLCV